MNNKRILKIAVVDCSVSGHRETYYRTFATVWAEMGNEVLLLAPQPSGTEEVAAFRRIDIRPLHPLPTNRPLQKKLVVLQNAAIRLRNLKSVRRQLDDFRPDVVFFPCLDDLLPTLGPMCLFDRLLPYRWSGLLVQSALPRWQKGMPDVRPYLSSSHCLGIGVLNEYSADDLKAFQPHVWCMPDFADLSIPDSSYPLLQTLRQRAGGRKIVSLLGSIGMRKGVTLLQQVIPLLPEDEYFFLIAGRSWLDETETTRLRSLESSRSNCLFSLERIPDEACFNALVAASDVIFAVYRNFTGSSNLLTKAAAFRRPVIVSRGACMGWRAEKYYIGRAIVETDANACRKAIADLCHDTKDHTEAYNRYLQQHSLGRLRSCLETLQENLLDNLIKTT